MGIVSGGPNESSGPDESRGIGEKIQRGKETA